jgi:hypothetical protein
MKKILAVLAISALMPFSGAAQAQDFPGWSLSKTCKTGDSSCVRFETFARGQISGTWKTLPPKQRAACIAETEEIGKSYRLLQGCLAIAMQELLRDQHRKPPSGEVVQLTPAAKTPEPPAPTPAPPPAPETPATPATPAPPQ